MMAVIVATVVVVIDVVMVVRAVKSVDVAVAVAGQQLLSSIAAVVATAVMVAAAM